MCKLNSMINAVNGNINWRCMEEIWFAQFGYCVTISYGRLAKTLSYLFDTTVQYGIDVSGHLSLCRIFVVSDLWIEQW